MRELSPPPRRVLRPSGALDAGSFRGALPPVDWSGLHRTRWFQLAHHKRWIYFALATDELFIAAAVVDLGYASNAFAFAFDKASKRMLADVTSLGPPFVGSVGDTMGAGCRANFRLGGSQVSLTRSSDASPYRLFLSMPDLRLEAAVSAPDSPPPVAAIAELPNGCANATEKRVLLPVVGDAWVAGKRYRLDGGHGGYDYTNGYLARHTAWRWAYAMGHAQSGERVGINLVSGFNGERECAIWVEDEVTGVGEGLFDFDPKNPRAPWRITTADGAVDLDFVPGGLHAEHKDLGLVRSRFIQPVGLYRGTLRVAGREPIVLDEVLGVAEDQDVLW
jgi:hypothetical protein